MKRIIERRITAEKDMRDYGSKLPIGEEADELE
jgi:hypothetical protein